MNKTSFGFKTVTPHDKNRLVQKVFHSVASGYDLMNDVMSLGLHRYWKQTFVDLLPLNPSAHILDVAGGTADIALAMMKRLHTKTEFMPLSGSITVLDRNSSMLHEGRTKAIDKGIVDLKWMCGDAESLPFPSGTFDIYTIAFGIRNVTDRNRALAEARRVLKKGGLFACLEFSHSPHETLDQLFQKLQFTFIPLLGQLILGDKDSYTYLVESIARFPNAKDFQTEIEAAGFKLIVLKPLVKGGVAIHMAVKQD